MGSSEGSAGAGEGAGVEPRRGALGGGNSVKILGQENIKDIVVFSLTFAFQQSLIE